jgi:ActR/RegA family two-component response regulator
VKTKNISSLIIDSDKDLSRNLEQSIKDIFLKVQILHDRREIVDNLNDFIPHVLFLNMNISQRSSHLDLLKQFKQNPKLESTLFFGYLDAQDPVLLAHAIEIGLHDIFARPFDQDIISSKINRFHQNDQMQSRELKYAKLASPIRAKLNTTTSVTLIDENGITMRCDHYVSKGALITINGQLSKDLYNLNKVELMVSKTWLGTNSEEYYLYAEPLRISEESRKSLKAFLLKNI